jgi:hypothetical protein
VQHVRTLAPYLWSSPPAPARHAQFFNEDVRYFSPPLVPNMVVTNPPWDMRLQGAADSWRGLRDFLKVGGALLIAVWCALALLYSCVWCDLALLCCCVVRCE